jgi:hypothetical protein
MIQTEFNGNFGLDEIKRIKLKNSGLNFFYVITFEIYTHVSNQILQKVNLPI